MARSGPVRSAHSMAVAAQGVDADRGCPGSAAAGRAGAAALAARDVATLPELPAQRRRRATRSESTAAGSRLARRDLVERLRGMVPARTLDHLQWSPARALARLERSPADRTGDPAGRHSAARTAGQLPLPGLCRAA